MFSPPGKHLKSPWYNTLLDTTVHKWFRGNFAAEDFSSTVPLCGLRVVSGKIAVSIWRFHRSLRHCRVIIDFEHFVLATYFVQRDAHISYQNYVAHFLTPIVAFVSCMTARYLLVTVLLLRRCWLNDLFFPNSKFVKCLLINTQNVYKLYFYEFNLLKSTNNNLICWICIYSKRNFSHEILVNNF